VILFIERLFGFVKFNSGWAELLFADEEDTKNLPESKEGEVYVMRFREDEGKRTPVTVQADWIVDGPLSSKYSGPKPDEDYSTPWYDVPCHD